MALNWMDFGAALVRSGDLDPLYIAINDSVLDADTKWRFGVAFWLFYQAGVSARIAEEHGTHFWQACHDSLKGPRGTERRHFRGQKAVDALTELARRFPEPELMKVNLTAFTAPTDQGIPFRELRNRVMMLPQFGPWMAFKVADMMERCYNTPVDFRGCDLLMYREPVRAAALIIHNDKDHPVTSTEAEALLREMATVFRDLRAPGGPDRALNLQEFETVLCKYKSHVGGHYPPGKDAAEIRHALEAFAPRCVAANALLEAMPPC